MVVQKIQAQIFCIGGVLSIRKFFLQGSDSANMLKLELKLRDFSLMFVKIYSF